MAAHALWMIRNRRAIRRSKRIFRDRTNPMDTLNDHQIHRRFRLPRQTIFNLVDEIENEIEYVLPRKGSLPALLQVCLTLRFYATGSYMAVIGDLIGVDPTTASRTVKRVTNALYHHVREWIHLPDQQEANQQMIKFHNMAGFPNVFGCVDGTHVRIQAPADGTEADYVNRKHFHSLNVQVICNADLLFINVVAKWPGSVHDARILRSSPMFDAFEGPNPPLDGIILGDSAYMLRTWLMTPLPRPATPAENRYNFCHSSTRCTVERAIGVAKQRFRCLRIGMVFEPEKVTKVIMVTLMLANRARMQNIPPPPDSDDEEPDDDEDSDDDNNINGNEDDGDQPGNANLDQDMNERARTAAGKRVRAQIIANNFTSRRR